MPGKTLLGFAAAAALLGGCQHFDRSRDCRKLARIVNPTLAAVDLERRSAPDAPATYRDAGVRYEQLAERLAKELPRGGPVGDLAAEYQILFREAALEARGFGSALDAKDLRRQNASRASAARTAKVEAQILSRVTGICARR